MIVIDSILVIVGLVYATALLIATFKESNRGRFFALWSAALVYLALVARVLWGLGC